MFDSIFSEITVTRWQHLNLAAVWHRGGIPVDYGVRSWLNISNSFIRATCVFQLNYSFYVLLVLQLVLLVAMATLHVI